MPTLCSVVVPVYNSATTLPTLFTRIKKTFQETDYLFEVIFVEDSGPDQSWTVLEQLKDNYPDEITIIRLARNYGQHSATLCGFQHSKGDLVITIDDDLQTPPEEIKLLLKKYEETKADLVYGFYPNKQHGVWRTTASKLHAKLYESLGYSKGEGSSFRLFTQALAKQIGQHRQHFIYIDEVLLWYTKHIAFVPVQHMSRTYGKSNYSFLTLVRLFTKKSLFHSTTLIRFIATISLVASFFSLLVALYFILIWFFFDVPVQGFTTIIVSIFCFGSLILFALGVIAEFLSKIHNLLYHYPQYTIKQKR